MAKEAKATRPKYKGEMLTGTRGHQEDVIGQLDELIALNQQGQRIAYQHTQQGAHRADDPTLDEKDQANTAIGCTHGP